jgi:hypothetical protein
MVKHFLFVEKAFNRRIAEGVCVVQLFACAWRCGVVMSLVLEARTRTLAVVA